jgi:hypothetical protein
MAWRSLAQREPIRALLAQLFGLASAALLAWMLPQFFSQVWPLAFAQGLAAAMASRAMRQPAWWQPMHLMFLPAVLAALSLHVPSEIYLAIFIFLALVFWGTAKGDVPLFLSSPGVALALAEMADDERARRFADLGAGLGSVVIPLAKHFPLLAVEAWERAPLPWTVLAWRGRKLANLAVRRRSLWDSKLTDYDMVFAFLSPAPMPQLGEKIRREMRVGSLFVSSSFPVPGWLPEAEVEVRDRRSTVLYCYRIQENMP